MEKMRVIVITIFLLICAAVAEEVGIGEAINPAKDAEIGGANVNPAEEADIGEAVNPTEEDDIGKLTNLKYNEPQSYESPRFKRFVTHCSSHIAKTCSGSDQMQKEGGGKNELALCLFDSIESCLVDHGASLSPIITNNNEVQPQTLTPIQHQSLLIETLKFRTVLRTCSHVTANSCFTAPHVALIAPCLTPTFNQCVYPATPKPATSALKALLCSALLPFLNAQFV
ncbi:hypothetical protein CR513_41871, partial [Mucuna pruriens]